jgi:ribokinase
MGLVDLLVASEGVPAVLGCPDPGRALQTLRRRCPGLVCVTLGQRGCLSLEREQERWTPAFDVQVEDTTGCGDVFRGALIHGVLEGWDAPRALRFAAAAAALNARAPGAQTGVPTRAEVLSFLETEPPVLDRRGRRQGERDLP